MKILCLLLPLILLSTFSQCQEIKYFSFIYGADITTKPHGTLLISIDKYISPNDNPPVDSLFGLSIMTDLKTFNFINCYLDSNRYTKRSNDINDEGEKYFITNTENLKLILPQKYADDFFTKLCSGLREKNLDKKVIEAFYYYYSNWRNPK